MGSFSDLEKHVDEAKDKTKEKIDEWTDRR